MRGKGADFLKRASNASSRGFYVFTNISIEHLTLRKSETAPTPVFLKSAYVDKPGSTDSSDISICEVVQLEDEGACTEIDG